MSMLIVSMMVRTMGHDCGNGMHDGNVDDTDDDDDDNDNDDVDGDGDGNDDDDHDDDEDGDKLITRLTMETMRT